MYPKSPFQKIPNFQNYHLSVFRSIAEENVSRNKTEPWFTCTLQNKEQCFHAKNGDTATQ